MTHQGWMTVTFAGLLLFGCGSEQSSRTMDVGSSSSVLLVASGGNTSCGTDADDNSSPYYMWMYENVEGLLNKLGNLDFAEVRYLITCHTSSSTVHYATSDEPGTVYSESISDYFNTLDAFATRDKEARVYMAGHSYGGWLAMKAVGNTNLHYAGIYTLDPISRETCTFTLPFGCTSAPEDIGDQERQYIADTSDYWHNYYQYKTWYLHSDHIDHADANTNLEVRHVDVDTDERVWGQIETSILRDAGHASAADS